ncbi:MFS transporter [Spirillospora sp. CA-294931]|uniref:MFS transporter n=1 Tax=Spirillospora sp. CA-294931 TaxID=3240042 RepID=UPI003D92086B
MTMTSALPGTGGSTMRGRLSVVAVMMGIFSIVTTEIMPIGLLTSIGAGFSISDGTAGLMMTMPGFLAAVAAPVVTVATARIDRRVMLCAFMLLLAAANFLAAVATVYWVMLISRVMVGITIGGFWSIGAGLGGRLVRPERVGRATALIFSGVPLGSVLGVPAGTLVGDLAGWRTAFALVGVLSLGILAAMVVVLPALPARRTTGAAVLVDALRSRQVRAGLAATFLIVLAHFGAYTYVTPFLEDVTGAGPGTVTLLLMLYGCAGVAGNFVVGARAHRNLGAAFGGSAVSLALATLLLPLLGRWDAGAAVLLVTWGIAYGAVPVCSQLWFAKAIPEAAEAASVIFTASFQATLSTGALVGGLVVDGSSPSAVMVLGGVLALLVALMVRVNLGRR